MTASVISKNFGFLKDLSSFVVGSIIGSSRSASNLAAALPLLMLLDIHSVQQTASQSRVKNKLCCSARLHCHVLKFKVNCLFISQNAYLQYVCFYLFPLT